MRYPVKGFTLIELMVVIALFGILASLAIPSFTRSIQKSKADTEVSDLMRGLNYARLEAIDRGVTTRIRIRPANTPSWPRRQRRWCPPDLSGHHF